MFVLIVSIPHGFVSTMYFVVYEGITGSNDTTFVLQDIREEVAAVNDFLQCCAASVCNLVEESVSMKSAQSSATCDLFGIPTTWNGAFYMPWSDTLSNANYFSEWLLLQSLNNMSLPSQLSFETILSLAKIHEVAIRSFLCILAIVLLTIPNAAVARPIWTSSPTKSIAQALARHSSPISRLVSSRTFCKRRCP